MLKAKAIGKPIEPIAAHGLVHATLCFIACICFCRLELAIFAFVLMFITHTAIDIFKGRLQASNEAFASPSNKLHWVLFGFDQLLHQFVLITIYLIVSNA
jgi:hypothetical protein